jgi:hypothetical protein
MLRTVRISVYVGTALPDDFTPTWHLPAAPIDEIARIILESRPGKRAAYGTPCLRPSVQSRRVLCQRV